MRQTCFFEEPIRVGRQICWRRALMVFGRVVWVSSRWSVDS